MFQEESSSSEEDEYDHEVEERLYFTVESGDSAHLQSLMNAGYNPNYKFEGSNQLDKTVLHLACEKGHEDCAKILLSAGAKINAQDAWYQTPLMYAVCTERENMVRLLIEHGANWNVSDKFTRCALHYAAMSETQDCLEALLEAGADINVSDETGRTPLYNVVTHDGKVKVVKYLLAHNAAVNVIELREMRPMLSSCILLTREDTPEYVRLLLAAGADPNKLDRYAHTPLLNLIKTGFRQREQITEKDLQIAELLLQYGTKVNLHCEVKYWFQYHGTPLKLAAERGCTPIVRRLLSAGANPDIPDQKNVYPIHCAATCGSLSVTQLLVWTNANLNCLGELKFSRDDYRRVTPFHCALIRNHDAVAVLLLQAGSLLYEKQLMRTSEEAADVVTLDAYRQSIHRYTKEILSQPKTLHLTVRLYLRKRLQQPFWPKVNKLTLPRQLKMSLGLPEYTGESCVTPF